MKTHPRTHLRIPAQGRFLPLVQGHVRDLARLAGLAGREVLALELAAEEAFQNICNHAFPDGTPGDVLVDGELPEGELRLAFQDEGLPFDPALLNPADTRPGDEAKGEPAGLGLRLIRDAVDEVCWTNRGRQGKALCLVKRLPRAEEPAWPSGPPAGPARPVVEHPAKAPERFYEVRPFRPEDALQVARLFWLTYGYTHTSEALYRPGGLLGMVERGALISHVAVTGDGTVVGHAGVLRRDSAPVAEGGLLAISPEHRGRGIMERLFACTVEKARDIGLYGLGFNAVTSHLVSQRMPIDRGARPCGLELAGVTPVEFKAMRTEDAPKQRESFLYCFRYTSAPPPALAHVPKRHQGMVGSIYESLGRSLTLAPDLADAAGGEPGAYAVTCDRGLSKGLVRVAVADARQWPEIRRAVLDLLDIAGAEVVHLDLPLAQADTPALCELAEAAGFFFAGVWPHAAGDDDVLRLTRLAAPLDLGQLRLYSPLAQELGRYVGAEMARAALAGWTA